MTVSDEERLKKHKQYVIFDSWLDEGLGKNSWLDDGLGIKYEFEVIEETINCILNNILV